MKAPTTIFPVPGALPHTGLYLKTDKLLPSGRPHMCKHNQVTCARWMLVTRAVEGTEEGGGTMSAGKGLGAPHPWVPPGPAQLLQLLLGLTPQSPHTHPTPGTPL